MRPRRASVIGCHRRNRAMIVFRVDLQYDSDLNAFVKKALAAAAAGIE